MKFSFMAAVGSGFVFAGLIAGAAPANADTINDFLGDLGDTGIANIAPVDIAPVDATALGQSVCPLLAERGQNTADIASTVADQIGRPLGAAPMFTGLAISALCPRAVTSISDLGF